MLCSRLMFVVCVLLSGIAVAFGQPPGPPDMSQHGRGGPSVMPGPPGQLPLVMLAAEKSVQADLKLGKTQKQSIQAIVAKLRESMPDHMPPPPNSSDRAARPEPPGGFPGGPGGPEPPDSADKDAKPKRGGDEMDKELATILSEEQFARLKQIALQLEGPHALLDPERAKELELTEEQVQKITRLTRKDEKSLKTILNDEQQSKWQEIRGKPFLGKIAFPSPKMPKPRN